MAPQRWGSVLYGHSHDIVMRGGWTLLGIQWGAQGKTENSAKNFKLSTRHPSSAKSFQPPPPGPPPWPVTGKIVALRILLTDSCRLHSLLHSTHLRNFSREVKVFSEAVQPPRAPAELLNLHSSLTDRILKKYGGRWGGQEENKEGRNRKKVFLWSGIADFIRLF